MPVPRLPDFNKTAVVKRPFGGSTVIYSELPVNWAPAMYGGNLGERPTDLQWDAWIDFPNDKDVRDGVSYSLDTDYWTYDEGDQVEIMADDGVRKYIYTVVWVMERWPGTSASHRRAYLIRTSWANIV